MADKVDAGFNSYSPIFNPIENNWVTIKKIRAQVVFNNSSSNL